MILVDDGSPDNVGAVLDTYANRANVKVFHKENGGISDARNFGIKAAKGKYLTFVDSDDFLAENAIETMMRTARQYSADIVEGSYTVFEDRDTYRQYSTAKNKFLISNAGNGMFGFAWGKVYKAKLFERVCFPKGYWFEDSIMVGLIFPISNVTVTIPQNVYWYYINQTGITHHAMRDQRSIDTFYVFQEILDAMTKLNVPVTDRTKSVIIRQLSAYVYVRCRSIGEENMKYMFVLCAQLAERYGVLCRDFIKKQPFWAQEVCEAFVHMQYERWELAAKMI